MKIKKGTSKPAAPKAAPKAAAAVSTVKPARRRAVVAGLVADVLVPRVGDQLDARAHVDDVTRPRLGEG